MDQNQPVSLAGSPLLAVGQPGSRLPVERLASWELPGLPGAPETPDSPSRSDTERHTSEPGSEDPHVAQGCPGAYLADGRTIVRRPCGTRWVSPSVGMRFSHCSTFIINTDDEFHGGFDF